MAYEKKMRDSLDYIEKNLQSSIQLEDLSRIVYLSKFHYHRLFHGLTGETVKRYISKRRMAAAAQELVLTTNRILDIALDYQFGSQEAFTRAFKRIYGLTPGEYRRQYTISSPRDIGPSGGSRTTCMAA